MMSTQEDDYVPRILRLIEDGLREGSSRPPPPPASLDLPQIPLTEPCSAEPPSSR
jgi:hypothetical protein